MSRKRPPRYSLHKASGQARARIDGRDIDMGVFGSPESREKYAHLIAEWLERNDEPQCRSTLTIEELALAHLDHAKGNYMKNNEETDHVDKVRAGLRLLIPHHRCESASDFTPRKLKCLQQVLIDRGRSRTYIIARHRVRRKCVHLGVEAARESSFQRASKRALAR